VEIGGNDQYFNILAGRRMMDAFGLPKQDIITFDLLTGTDGKKMSKTSPNCIAIDDTPFDMYQKIINLHDDMITHYAELATDMSLEEVEGIKKRLASGEAPNILKEELAQRIIMMYHGKPYDPESTDSIEVFTLSHPELVSGSIQISTLLKVIGFCATTGDVKNSLSGNSVRINGEVITDPKYMVKIQQE
jgi:tyrosyl-tRNA synthetase